MPRLLNEILSRPWAVALVIVGAFVLPLLASDVLGGGEPPRRIALVSTEVAADEEAAPAGATIPDLQPAIALPRLRTTPVPPAAAAVPAETSATPATGEAP